MRLYRLPAIPDPHISSAPDSPLRLSAIMCRDATLPGSGIATHRIHHHVSRLTEILSPTVPILRNNYGLTLL
jgi:hypothetical protein